MESIELAILPSGLEHQDRKLVFLSLETLFLINCMSNKRRFSIYIYSIFSTVADVIYEY